MGEETGPLSAAGHPDHPGRHHRHHGPALRLGQHRGRPHRQRQALHRRCSWPAATSISAKAATTAIPRRCGRWWPRCCATATIPSPANSSTIAPSSGARNGPARTWPASAASIRTPGTTSTWPRRPSMVPRSNMPAYAFLNQGTVDPAYTRRKMEVLGFPLPGGRDQRPAGQNRDGCPGRLPAETRQRHPLAPGRPNGHGR